MGLAFISVLVVMAGFIAAAASVPTTDASLTPPLGEILPRNNGGLKVTFSLNRDYIQFDSKIEPRDWFWAIWDRRQASVCDETPYDLGRFGCRISFECHGNDDWATTNALANTLVDVVAGAPGVRDQWATTRQVCSEFCDDPRKPKTRCCGPPETQTDWHTRIPRTMAIYIANMDTSSDRGELRYRLTCDPQPSPFCALANAAADFLGGPAGAALDVACAGLIGVGEAIAVSISRAAC
jgi:hypothetical protein